MNFVLTDHRYVKVFLRYLVLRQKKHGGITRVVYKYGLLDQTAFNRYASNGCVCGWLATAHKEKHKRMV